MRYKYLTLVLLISSCGTLDTNRIAPGYTEAFKAIKGAIFGLENELLSRELIDQISFASSVLKIGKGAPGLIILESIQNKEEVWVSSDKVYLVLRKGKIVKTSGLDNNLIDLKTSKIDFSDLIGKEDKLNLTFYYSFENPDLNNLKVNAEISYAGLEEVFIFEKKYSLHQITERISNSYIGWEAENKYWIDGKGYVWKSKQYISPKLPEFSLEVTKKPAL